MRTENVKGSSRLQVNRVYAGAVIATRFLQLPQKLGLVGYAFHPTNNQREEPSFWGGYSSYRFLNVTISNTLYYYWCIVSMDTCNVP